MRYGFSLLVSLLSFSTFAQDTWGEYLITCSTQDTVDAFVAAPDAFLSGSATQNTEFILSFSGNVPGVAEASMTFAANVWGSYLESDVPIRVDVDWRDEGNPRLLASAGPTTFFRSFALGLDPEIFYPVALAEAIAGRELNESADADIRVVVNSTANWYFGIDGRTPNNRIDLASVFLHELGHGLGFLSSVDTINTTELGIGLGGRFIVYDPFLETPDGRVLTNPTIFANPGTELLNVVGGREGGLIFAGDQATERNGGNDVPLFAPRNFDNGSSVSHLNETTYRPGNPNALMTPFLAAGEAAHDPGPVTLGLFADLGWPLRFELEPSSVTTVNDQQLRVFPNPLTGGRLSVELPEGTFAVELYGPDGRRVLEQQPVAAGKFLTLEVGELPPGLYTLALESDGARISRRIVIAR